MYARLEGFIPFKPILLLAAIVGLLLGLAFSMGSWIQILVVAMIPFILYAVVRNTMIVFLLWIGTSPILTNFVSVGLGAGIPDITVNRVASLMLMVTLLFQIAIKIRRLQKVTVAEWAMLSVTMVLLPAIFRGYVPIQSGQIVFDHLVTPFIVFFLAKNLITTKDEIRPLIWTLGFVTLYCAVLGFQEHFTEYSLFTESGELNWQQEGMADRIQGPFESPQILGSVMVGGIVFFFYQMFNARNLSMRLFSLLVLIIHTFVTYWTYRRSVWMGYFATMIFLGMAEQRFRKPLGIITGISLAIALVNWQFISDSSVFQDRLANYRTVNDRAIVWLTSWEIIKHYPVLGTGLGWFGFYYERYFTFFGNTVTTDYAHGITSAHNSYVRMWVEGGPGLLLVYMWMLGVLTWRAVQLLTLRLIHPCVGKMEVMVFVGIFITQYVQSLTTDLIFHGQYSAILIFMIAGVLFQRCERAPKRRSPGSEPLIQRSAMVTRS